MSRTRENPAESGIRYYGYYSNVSRGKKQKENHDVLIPCILEPEENSKEYRKNWAYRFLGDKKALFWSRI